MKKSDNKQSAQRFRGITLLEMLLYVSIVTGLLIMSGIVAMNVVFGKARILAFEEVGENARSSFHHVENGLNDAAAMTVPALGEASSTISFRMSDPDLDPTVFRVEDGVLTMQQGAYGKVAITSSAVRIANVLFSNVSFASSSAQTLRVEMTLSSGVINPRGNQKVTKTFYTTLYKDDSF